MRSIIRLVIGIMALGWMAGVALWAVWDHTTHHIVGQDISPAQWERARQASGDDILERDISPAQWERARQGSPQLPILWRAGDGKPPLLPVSGEIILRGREVTLNDGLALVPATFAAQSVGIMVAFERTPFDRYPGLDRPLLPFQGEAAEDRIWGAPRVELCAGIADPTKAHSQGLWLRLDTSGVDTLGVYRGNAEVPLFPARIIAMHKSSFKQSSIEMSVNGNHVLGYANDELLLDFHTTMPVTGAVGIGACKGVIKICELKVYVPE